jgi:hypothetical protein
MSLIIWLPLEGHAYEPVLRGEEEQPEDGFQVISQWIGEDAYEKTSQCNPKRRYWLQLLGRGANDRKALLTVYGIPVPPEVNEEHIEDAVSYLGWPDFTSEPKHRGCAWIFPKIS